MIKFRCVEGYADHKKGDLLDKLPEGGNNAFVPVNVAEPPASVTIKTPLPAPSTPKEGDK